MTNITYEDGKLNVTAHGQGGISATLAHLGYESRMAIITAANEMQGVRIHDAGYLKSESIDTRRDILEEILGVSLPLSQVDDVLICERCGRNIEAGMCVHEIPVEDDLRVILCDTCYEDEMGEEEVDAL